MQTTDLANTSISTVRLVELAILGLNAKIEELTNDRARLLQELVDLRNNVDRSAPLVQKTKWVAVKPKGRPPVPTACEKCGKLCPSKGLAEVHCGKRKAKSTQKKVSKTA